MEKDLSTIKNVVCPHCGYILPLIYDENTVVKGLLVTCKGRQCKKNFVLTISKGMQIDLSQIPQETIKAFKLVFGEDYIKHLQDKYENCECVIN